MVTIKEATQNAMRFAQDSLGELRTEDMRLEEIDAEIIDEKDYWLITLSMADSNLSTDLATTLTQNQW